MTPASHHKKILKIQVLWICLSCIFILISLFLQWSPLLFSLNAGLLFAVSFCSSRILFGDYVWLIFVLAVDILTGTIFLAGYIAYHMQSYLNSSVLISTSVLVLFLVFSGFLCRIVCMQLDLLRQNHLLNKAYRKKTDMYRNRTFSELSHAKSCRKFPDNL